MGQIDKYIEKLGFSNKSEPTDFGELFSYSPKISNNNIIINYIFYKDENSLFNYHLSEWNKNELDFFIAVGKDRSYIIKAKEKANNDNILRSNVVIRSFDYGINTAGYENIVSSDIPFTKEKIDNSVFFNFVLEKQEKIKNEIDTHLLNNLIALKSEMSEFDKNNENINGLILKSLFIKYLEDRNILSNTSLVDAVKNKNSVEKLKKTFNDISIINGDILKKDLSVTKEHTKELEIFFTEDYKEYKESGSRYIPGLFPYKFDKIPIQLISNIYEEFLGKTEKKTKGIFYTRTFVVDFMLSHTIYPKIQKYPNSTILDPACGSGAFLVQTFKKILNTQQEKKLSIDEKANILKKQIFGVDIDANALQITAFSLYLTLLDGINKDEIQEQIEKQTPILPPLIGSNLLQKNAITDEIKFIIEIDESNEKKNYTFSKFDCIVTNPPWSVVNSKTLNSKEIRKVHKERELYSSIHNRYLQLSQFFLLKIYELSHANTLMSIIINSSNFYSKNSKEFRKEFLKKFRLKKYLELSKLKKILFKSAGEPASVLIFDLKSNIENKVKYIAPKLTKFSENFRVITHSNADIKEIKQTDLIQEDILWKIFVNGNWRDYQLIKKKIITKDNIINISCEQGIQGQVKPSLIVTNQAINVLKELQPNDEFIEDAKTLINKIYHTNTDLKKVIEKITDKHNIKIDYKTFSKIKDACKKQIVDYEPKEIKKYFDKDDFHRYSFGLDEEFVKTIRKEINWSNNIKRKRNKELYFGERFLILRQPKNEEDGLRLRTLYTNQHFIFPDKIMGLKITPHSNYNVYFAILNSMFAGYYLINTSSQWYKGRRDTLLNEDFEKFPFPELEKANTVNKINNKIELIKKYKELNKATNQIEKEIDELVFNLYDFLEFEKDIIREFYQINVGRKNDNVKPPDIQVYTDKFREVYQLMVKDDLRLNASFIKSNNIGTIVKFDIVNEKSFTPEVKQGGFEQRKVLQLVKDYQIQQEMLNGYINEEKVKIYDGKSFYIIKSNQFKDWTKRQATEDANDETREMMKKMF